MGFCVKFTIDENMYSSVYILQRQCTHWIIAQKFTVRTGHIIQRLKLQITNCREKCQLKHTMDNQEHGGLQVWFTRILKKKNIQKVEREREK